MILFLKLFMTYIIKYSKYFITILSLFFISFSLTYWEQEKSLEDLQLEASLTDNQEILGYFTLHWRSYALYTIPHWKNNIMDKYWLNSRQKIHYHIINTSLECSREDWFCKWGGWADVWPFQINQIHKNEWYYQSINMINEWKQNELYEYQLKWTIDRMERFKNKWQCSWTETEVYKCMLVRHNWNTKYNATYWQFRYFYAAKWLTAKSTYLSIIQEKYKATEEERKKREEELKKQRLKFEKERQQALEEIRKNIEIHRILNSTLEEYWITPDIVERLDEEQYDKLVDFLIWKIKDLD